MQLYAIIVAGGSGTRMGSSIPKQFLPVAGKPILFHTMQKFYDFAPTIKIILVLPKDQIPFWDKLRIEYEFNLPHEVAEGGETRFQSVKNGLSKITAKGVVAIHDGVRPLVSQETITRAYRSAFSDGNGIPAIDMVESVRMVEKEKNYALDRSKLKIIQTPQVFKTDIILKGFDQDYDPLFTDDASVIENMGEAIILTQGNKENIKITNPADLLIAEKILSRKDEK